MEADGRKLEEEGRKLQVSEVRQEQCKDEHVDKVDGMGCLRLCPNVVYPGGAGTGYVGAAKRAVPEACK